MDTQSEELEPEAPQIDAVTMGKAPETVNLLASITDEEEQRKIGSRVWKDYDRDYRSSERY